MATNLLLGFPAIPTLSVSTSFNQTASTLYPYANLFGGNQTDLMYLNSEVTGDARFTFDVGSKWINRRLLIHRQSQSICSRILRRHCQSES
jgi:hypothetical protein